MSDKWFELITLLITSGTIAIFWKEIKKAYWFFQNWRKRKVFEDFFKNTVAIDKILNEIINIGSHRVLVMRAHNGGSSPKIGKRLYSSLAFCEYDRTAFPEGIHDFQNFVLEPAYVKNLLKLVSLGQFSAVTAEWDDQQLKDIYSYEGIKHSELYKLCVVNDSLYYMSVSTKNDKPFTQKEKSGFSYGAGAIKSLLLS
mgnify:FL=1|jgi:hypothetical protein|tara:strand:- start:3671 stop:4264 length:594 start_codon:yes stop_codon:yes gene_type:complete